LKVVIPELQSLAYLVVHTTSIIDIRNISEQLEAIRQINNGRIAGIPLVLRRRPKKVSVPGENGQKTRMTKYMISIEADPQWVAAMLTKLNQAALPGSVSPLLPETTQAREEYEEVQEDDIIDEPWTEEIAEEQEEQGEPEEESEPEETGDKCDNPPAPGPDKMSLSFAENLLTLDQKSKLGDMYTDELKKSVTKYQTTLNERKNLTDDQRKALQLRIEAANLIVECREHKPA
jgi:hypothetical protein